MRGNQERRLRERNQQGGRKTKGLWCSERLVKKVYEGERAALCGM
jgi:hypothetical protein